MPTPAYDLFRQLNEGEEEKFRQWARRNYKPGQPIITFWHPVVRDECQRMIDAEEAWQSGDYEQEGE
jgi:hypothetical protein